ncbi:hypothetical protein C2845_PM13G10270 [Panicum miliaceum]|uniref:Uncharacterized protein n=1 Tax=Panicum miliaceum TaxID=4540 RepID=A0A3L6RJP9_PANMI|nr:hypothetical protein C2845_PM13G10270 [Panicum miliaceum]
MRSECREGFIHFSVKEKWENWEREWLYVEVSQDSPFLRLPDGPPMHGPGWSERLALGSRWDPVLDRFARLQRDDLSWVMVAFDFLWRRLAPLQARRNLAWYYAGDDDDTRIVRGAGSGLDEVRLSQLMRLATDEGDLAAGHLPGEIRPLCDEVG